MLLSWQWGHALASYIIWTYLLAVLGCRVTSPAIILYARSPQMIPKSCEMAHGRCCSSFLPWFRGPQARPTNPHCPWCALEALESALSVISLLWTQDLSHMLASMHHTPPTQRQECATICKGTAISMLLSWQWAVLWPPIYLGRTCWLSLQSDS